MRRGGARHYDRIMRWVWIVLMMAVPLQAAETVRSLIEQHPGALRKPLDQFYAARGDALAWTRDGRPTPQAAAILKILLAAEEKGLDPSDYDAEGIGRMEDDVRYDVALTRGVMRYVADIHIGRVNPRRLDFLLDPRPRYALVPFVTSLIDVDDVAAKLEPLEPQYEGYRRLRDALAHYRAIEAQGPIETLPAIKILEPGGSWEGVPKLAALLQKLGDLEADVTGDHYQGAIVDAVKSFQRRNGLEPDGRIGAGTLAAMNTPLRRRIEQMALTLERWRWAPSNIEGTPIVVNIPEFRLRAYDENPRRVAVEMNVVVGSAYNATTTPVFTDTMEYVVFRPYWNVPPSIQREMAPKIKADPSYLRRNNYERVGGRIRQKPGPGNSLGNVKFIFPNSMNIYLHDTPSKQFFERTRRDFSHGCIRVSKPAELAEWLLRDDPKWTAEAVKTAMASGPGDAHVKLKRMVPVLIVYGTVAAREDGQVYFFDDIYGHDARLEDALAAR